MEDSARHADLEITCQGLQTADDDDKEEDVDCCGVIITCGTVYILCYIEWTSVLVCGIVPAVLCLF